MTLVAGHCSRRRFAAATLGLAAVTRFPIAFGRTAAADHDAAAVAQAAGGQDPMVAANPTTGTVYLAWVQPAATGVEPATPAANGAPPAPAGRVRLARSDDGGRTFGDPVDASGDDPDVISYVGSSPLVSVGPEGEVLVAYQRNVAREGVDFGRDLLRLARSVDDGRTFAPAVDVFQETEAVEAGTFHDLLVAPDGAVYVAWLSYRQYMPENGAGDDPKVEVRVARSDDGGATFGLGVLVDDVSCECCRTALALDAAGTLYVAWRDRVEQPDGGDPVRNIVVARSTDRGATWDAPTAIHDDGWRVGQCPESGPALGVDGDGRLHAAWFTGKEDGPGVYYAASDDGGRSFSPPIALATADYFPHANVRGALADDGSFWVAWDDSRTEAGSVSLARIAADGTVPADPAEAAAGRTPDVAVGPNGVVLTWLADDGVDVTTLPAAENGS